jgi:hypothetical protein
MRFISLVYAALLCACGSSGTQDAGVDGSSNDGSTDAASDAPLADAGPVDNECLEAGTACSACCATNHPDASGIFDNSMGTCACSTCNAACATSFCASKTSTKSCDQCLTQKCYPAAKTACNADPACAAWLACLVPCP